jgi:hypothetical protein
MSLRTAVAAPFKGRGADRLDEGQFVVALSLDRDWFSPDQAKRLVDIATSEGLVERDGDELVAAFDPTAERVPEDFVPDEDLLRGRSPFERVLDRLVEAGHEKREVVADINALQAELGVTVEAAAVLYARRRGVDVGNAAQAAREALRERDDF